jgi:hypothetical protein
MQTPRATRTTTVAVVSTTTPNRTTTAGGMVSAAANATQRSCWRSLPRARRKRTTNDHAPTARPPIATVNDTAMTAATALASAGRLTGSIASS